MLLELDIRDFALIANLTFRPKPGFVALTGETGAGKSILIGALAQLSGDRADTSMVRSGADMALLHAVFTDSDGNEVILARELLASGRTVARLDGRIVPLTHLRERGQRLIAIHGQREGQRIFDEATHRPLLDRFCHAQLQPALDNYEKTRRHWILLTDELKSYGADPAKRARRADVLAHQIKEIKDMAPVEGEEEALQEKARQHRMLNMVYSDLAKAMDDLSEAEEDSVLDRLGAVRDRLVRAGGASKTIRQIKDRIEESLALLDGIQHDLGHFFGKIEIDPAKLTEIEARLDDYGRLKYKYGNTTADILTFLQKSKAEYERLVTAEGRIKELEKQIEKTSQALRLQARQVHDIRQREAKTLVADILTTLAELDMKNVRFEIDVEMERAEWTLAEGGLDRVRFLISPNLGEPLRPLAKIASGGEAARLLLALKSILAELDDIPVLVFDEVDAGISGHTAKLVGEKLHALGRLRHVFCVTHSAPIAAAASYHYKISKTEVDGRTITGLNALEGKARVAEIARLLSGKEDDPPTRRLAETMLSESAKQDGSA